MTDAWPASFRADGRSRATVSIGTSGDAPSVPPTTPRSGRRPGDPAPRSSHSGNPPPSHIVTSPSAVPGAPALAAGPGTRSPRPASWVRPGPDRQGATRARPAIQARPLRDPRADVGGGCPPGHAVRYGARFLATADGFSHSYRT